MADPTPDVPTPEPDPVEPDPDLTPETDAETAKWKELSRKNEREAKRLRAELEKAQQASMSEQEKAVALAKSAGYTEGLSAATERLRRAEVRAAASGLLADPSDAVHLLDLEKYTPDDDGDFDRKAIEADISALVKAKPYLGATPGNGSGEGGPRGSTPQPHALNGDPLQRALEAKLGIR